MVIVRAPRECKGSGTSIQIGELIILTQYLTKWYGLPFMKTDLERALSKMGIASRTEAAAMIRAGEVRVNGRIQRNPLFKVALGVDAIEVGGVEAKTADRIVILLNKPRGSVTTRSDEKGRRTVFDVLGEKSTLGLHAVGRLDLATSGLLVLTNDTSLSSWLTDPKNAIMRVYLVSVRGELTEEKKRVLERGIDDDGERLHADSIEIRKASRKETHLVVTLKEGKNREIRRLFKALGHEVTRLKRVAFGGLTLGELQPGEHRVLSESELSRAFPTLPKR